jgi:hypothetical protein
MLDRIRAADLVADRALLTDLLTANLSFAAGGRRFDWLYRENPHGPALALIATEAGTQRCIGAAAAFPKRLYIKDEVRTGYVLGDFCIDQQYRTLGLALQLQRACLEQLDEAGAVLGYDFPSESMMAVYRRLKLASTGHVVRWSKPLRASRQVGKFVKNAMVARVLAAPVNKFLAWRDPSLESGSDWKITEQTGECGEAFTRLAQRVGASYGACVERSSAYLNWRYLRHPAVRYEFLAAWRGAELLGYVVFSQTGEDAKIVDLLALSDTSVCDSLMAHLIVRLRERAVVTVSAPLVAASPWTGLLQNWGFRPREQSPLVVWQPGPHTARQNSELTWFLMDGDRES